MQGSLLIADGVATNRIMLKTKLARSGYEVVQVASAARLLDRARALHPALIVVADTLPDMRARALCAVLSRESDLADIPLIVIARSDDAAERLALLEEGADEVFAHPLQPVVFKARLRSLIRAQTGVEELNLRDSTSRALGFAEAQESFAAPASVALLTPEARTAEHWRSALAARLGATRLTAHTYRDTLGQMAEIPVPDVFVIGLHGRKPTRGLRLLADLRANPATRHSSVVAVLDPHLDQDLGADALDLGAGDLMVHGFDPQELALRLKSQISQKQTQDRLRASVQDGLRAAMRDPMTGLFNRRYAMPYLARMIAQNLRLKRGFAVMLADIDHFKSVNDRFGHEAGDAVLTEAARRLQNDLRAEDLIARIGGEEFLIVLPDATRDEAGIAAERLRGRIAGQPFALPDPLGKVRVTVSIGVALCCFDCLSSRPPDESTKVLLRLADSALYDAKHAGRNTVTTIAA